MKNRVFGRQQKNNMFLSSKNRQSVNENELSSKKFADRKEKQKLVSRMRGSQCWHDKNEEKRISHDRGKSSRTESSDYGQRRRANQTDFKFFRLVFFFRRRSFCRLKYSSDFGPTNVTDLGRNYFVFVHVKPFASVKMTWSI